MPTTTTPGTSASHPYADGAIGYDVSWPQCSPGDPSATTALPKGASFAIVGVNSGVISGFNSCFSAEAAWAGRNMSVYIVLQPAPGGRPTQEYTGPEAACAPTSAKCEGYDWGYNYAEDDLAFVRAHGLDPKVWWLDIELAELWPTSKDVQPINAAIVQGALDAISRAGDTVGIYSTWYQWGQITGSYVPERPGPIWVAGAQALSGNNTSAVAYCQRAMAPGDPSTLSSASIGFADGAPWLVQYGYGYGPPVDPDYSCS